MSMVLLDERGALITSEDFAARVERWSLRGVKKIVLQ
jgi:23S rRNA pseudoU1915 N3-methylase RlmH